LFLPLKAGPKKCQRDDHLKDVLSGFQMVTVLALQLTKFEVIREGMIVNANLFCLCLTIFYTHQFTCVVTMSLILISILYYSQWCNWWWISCLVMFSLFPQFLMNSQAFKVFWSNHSAGITAHPSFLVCWVFLKLIILIVAFFLGTVEIWIRTSPLFK
jgi:hypothetical protein